MNIVAPPGAKWCPKCEAVKDTGAFHSNPRLSDGLDSWCMACCRQAKRDTRARHGEKYRKRARKHRRERRQELLATDEGRLLLTAEHRHGDGLRRRPTGTPSDVTPVFIAGLLLDAESCPLCDVVMTDDPREPHAKQVDHIIPLAVGGTHSLDNIRVICGRCNGARPKDGSDVVPAAAVVTV